MKNKIILKITAGALLFTMFAYTMPIMAYAKEETIYSKQNSEGKIYSSIISSKLEDGSFEQEETKKELPVDCKIKYELDGNEIDARTIAGKSGKVKITLEYTNKESHSVKNNTLYTPFLVIGGTIFDNENNKNIKITNGKILDNGEQTIAVGMCLPGMKESLDIQNSEFEIPNTIEITMDTTKFELSNIITYITPKIMEDIDESVFNKINDIYNNVDKLERTSKQLEEGANTLKEGTITYNEKSQEFNSAMKQIAEGTNTVNSNYSKLDNGISNIATGSNDLKNGATELNSGINQLTTALNSLPEGVSTLYKGSVQVLNGLNSNSQTGDIGLVDGVNSAISSLETTTNTLKETLTKSAEGSSNSIKILKANNEALKLAINTLSAESTENNSEAINQLQKQIAINENVIATYENAVATANQTKEIVEKKAEASKGDLQNIKTGMKTIQNAMTQITGGLENLNTEAQTLPANLEKLSKGSNELEIGSKTLATGATTLNSSSSMLKSGIQNLDVNTQKLTNANNQLTEGATTIQNGATTLSDGMTKFNNEGIAPICNLINGRLKNITNKFKDLKDLEEAYNNEEERKFIIVTDGVKEEFIAKEKETEK